MQTESWGLLLFVMQLLINILHITACLEKGPAKLIMFPSSISIIIIPWWGNIVALIVGVYTTFVAKGQKVKSASNDRFWQQQMLLCKCLSRKCDLETKAT